MLLDTGGGILHATRSFKKPFVAVNPDTLWSDAYCNELKDLEDLYFKKKKPCLLLVNKNLSFDSSFKGDFNLQDGMISRDNNNEFIFTGLQISIGVAWFSLVAAEMVSGDLGLGYLIVDAYMNNVTVPMVIAMITLGFIGYFSSALVRMLGNKLMAWHVKELSQQGR